MYPWEIEKFLKDRNYYIGGDDLNFIIDTKKHPQIDHIEFSPDGASYNIWDKYGNHYHFNAMPYKEAKEKGYVKRDDDDLER